MKKIAFVTSVEDPNLNADDLLVFPFLEKQGYTVSPIVWDLFKAQDISGIEALVFRSCWNYHRRYSDFLLFLDQLQLLKVPTFNSLDVIRWNLNKKHILELGKTVLIPKTKLLEAGQGFSVEDLKKLVEEWNLPQLIVKPAVSLNGQDTYLFSASDLLTIHHTVSQLLVGRDVLIQEFVSEIKTKGEISLVYFNKIFSHAVCKTPAAHEFRVHGEYGGTRVPVEASLEALAYGQSILIQIKENLLYARVDLVETSRGPILIELEVTDPMLYLSTHTQAPQNFANAILSLQKR